MSSKLMALFLLIKFRRNYESRPNKRKSKTTQRKNSKSVGEITDDEFDKAEGNRK